jgi:hypothetical protein
MKPFERARVPQSETDKLLADLRAAPPETIKAHLGLDELPSPEKVEELIKEVVERALAKEYWNNDKYQVSVFDAETDPDFPAMWHVSVKRHDRYPIFNWRDIQTMKNELFGPEHEAVQLFPAESRLVDGANQYHLYVLKEAGLRFPFGFTNRAVTDSAIGKSKNRKFE